jgi:hypothetical protein
MPDEAFNLILRLNWKSKVRVRIIINNAFCIEAILISADMYQDELGCKVSLATPSLKIIFSNSNGLEEQFSKMRNTGKA